MTSRTLIIGAGLAGLTAARILIEHDQEILVVDKGRSVGGRLATRRMGDATLDHGAQFFTVRSPEFQTAVDVWLSAGLVEEWCLGFSEVDGYPRYRVVGGMNALAKALAIDIPVVKSKRVNALIPGADMWTATYEGSSRQPDDAAAVIATPPVPQLLELLAAGPVPLTAEVQTDLESITYHRVIALLAKLDENSDLPDPGALQQPDDPTFTFVADNRRKGISTTPAMTFHLSHNLSEELWAESDDAVLDAVSAELDKLAPGKPSEIQVKRWRYAGPRQPRTEPCLVIASGPGPLVVAGDAFANAKVEGAFLSGLAAAATVL